MEVKKSPPPTIQSYMFLTSKYAKFHPDFDAANKEFNLRTLDLSEISETIRNRKIDKAVANLKKRAEEKDVRSEPEML